MAPVAPPSRPRTGWLATPLSEAEQRHVARMYREHRGLIRLMGSKMCRKYPFVACEDIFSCIDTAFVKTCRAWNPDRGTFSTLLTVFSEGDILHFIRDNNWLVKAPGNVRRLGQQSRRLMKQGMNAVEVQAKLAITAEQLRLALIATQPTDHDIRGFELHVCPRPNPWEMLDATEN